MTFNSVYLSGMVTRLCHIFSFKCPRQEGGEIYIPLFWDETEQKF